MASVAYALDNMFSVPAQAEREMRARHRGSTICISQSGAEARCGSYIDLAEQLDEASQYNRGGNQCEGIIGSSRALCQVLDHVRTVAPTDSTVLIEGATGTGKELIAHAIHSYSRRRDRAFIKVNCAAIPLDLLESELFGHEKGAFTGAVTQRLGRFEAANGGTLFLDEVGDMPLALQPKLLRVLQEQEFERLGSTQTRRVDVRIVAATNQDLGGRVAQKQFRSDLYYRLNVFPIALPVLARRQDDIPMLVAYFVRKFSERMSKQISKISEDAMDTLMRYPWPGNIRELQNFIERAVILTNGDVLQIPVLPCGELIQTDPASSGERLEQVEQRKIRRSVENQNSTTLTKTLAEAERDHILNVLEESNWVVSGKDGAAARLGVPRTTLISKMRRRGISCHTAQNRFAM